VTGDSLTLHVFVLVSMRPAKSTAIGPVPDPAVVGSMAVISCEPATGWLGESEITAADAPAAATTRASVFDCAPPGFCTETLTVPAEATSAGAIVTVHAVALAQAVFRAAPSIITWLPGPGLVGTKFIPVSESVKLLPSPAVTLSGASDSMAAAEASATVALAVCVGSSLLVAVIVMALGLGAEEAAV
jgi:hypothetical protein